MQASPAGDNAEAAVLLPRHVPGLLLGCQGLGFSALLVNFFLDPPGLGNVFFDFFCLCACVCVCVCVYTCAGYHVSYI